MEKKLELDMDDAIIEKIKKKDLIGLDGLWDIAFHASNNIVQERAGYLLAIISYFIMDKKSEKWGEETNEVVQDLIDNLKNKVTEPQERANNVKVLREFIDVFEALEYPPHFRYFYKKLYEEEDEGEEDLMPSDYYGFFNYKWHKQRTAMFKVEHLETTEKQYIEIDIKESCINLKKEIGKKFNINIKQFEIMYGDRAKEFLESSNDWLYVYQIIKKVVRVPNSNNPVEIFLDLYDDNDYRERSITYSIVEEPTFSEILCDYLKKADINTSIETISIIERLPVLSDNLFDLKNYIEGHKIEKHDHWYTVLKVKFDQPEELFMKIKLLENLLCPSDFYEIDLREQFIANSGVQFLIDIVVQACTILITNDNPQKFALCASLISKTLKLFGKVLVNSQISEVLDQENSLILMKSGLDFLKFMSISAPEKEILSERMNYQLEKDRVIIDIFHMFTNIILSDNSRFKTIRKYKKLKEILFFFLIDTNNDYEKKDISYSLLDLTRRTNDIGRADFKEKTMPGEFFIGIFEVDFLPLVLENIYNDAPSDPNKPKSKKLEEVERLKVKKCYYFFDLLAKLIDEVDEVDDKVGMQIADPLVAEFTSCNRIEANEDANDERLAQLIYLISAVFKKCPKVKDKFADKTFFNFVVDDCLFRKRKDRTEMNYPI